MKKFFLHLNSYLLIYGVSMAQYFSVVGSGTTSNSSWDFPAPFGTSYRGARHQFFVPAAELLAAGVPAGAEIKSIGFYRTGGSTQSLSGWTVTAYTTTSPDPLASGWHTSGWAAQHNSTAYPSGVGWQQFTFSSPFTWNGTDNLVIETCFFQKYTSSNHYTRWTTNLSGATYSRWYHANKGFSCGSSSVSGSSTTTRPDIRIEWNSNTLCTTVPTSITTTSSLTSVCPSTYFTLSLSPLPLGPGYTYQWEYSVNGGITWISMGNSTPPIQTTLVPYRNIQYRCTVTCTETGQSVTSTPVTVYANNCGCLSYCTPSVNNSPCNVNYNYITNVTSSGGIVNFNNSTGCSSSGYDNYAGLYYPTQYPGATVNLSITSSSSGPPLNYRVFVDWNGDGDFLDVAETAFSINNTSMAYTVTGTIQVPAWATPGSHRMRVASEVFWNGLPSSCGPIQGGEVEDYCFSVVSPPDCNGTPNPGSTTASVTTACPQVPFTLGLSNPLYGNNLSYNWELSTDGGITWTSFSNLEPPVQVSLNSFSSVQYRCIVTCLNSGLSAISTPITVNSGTQCNCTATFCNPAVSSPCNSSYGYISQVSTTGGLFNFSNSTSCTSPGYSNFAGTHTVSQFPGGSFTISLQSYSGWGYSFDFKVYVDWNNDGDYFDNWEEVLSADNVTTASGTVVIPSWATPGSYRLRVLGDIYWNNINSACATLQYGEIEDYCLNVIPPPPCSGVPTTGSTSASASLVCPASPTFNLTLNNPPIGSNLSFNWQMSTDGGTTWTSFSTSPPPINVTLSPFVTTQYRCIITCNNSGYSVTSAPVTVTAGTHCECVSYCTPSVGSPCSWYGYISQVSTSGALTNFTNNSSCSSGYTNYAGTYSASQYPGGPVTVHLSSYSSGGHYFHYAVFVDWNADGDFSDTEEQVVSFTNSSSLTTVVDTFNVPLWVTPGTYRMRVASEITWYSVPGSCGYINYGEVEDYCLSVLTPPPCSGTPTAGLTLASIQNACPSQTVTLNLSTPPIGSGVMFNWEYSTDGGIVWTSFSTQAPPVTYTFGNITTQFRCTVTCSNSGQSVTSTPVTVHANPCQCQSYCWVGNYYGCSWWYGYTSQVSTSGGVTNFSNSSGCGGYSNYAGQFSASQYPGATFTLNITQSGYYSSNISAFIDWNGDGDFNDTGEQIISQYSSYSASANITVPTWATPGTYRLRIRSDVYWYSIPSSCGYTYYGETEDYCFTVLPLLPCAGTPNPGNTTSSSTSVCQSSPNITLNLSNSLASYGYISYQWQKSTDNGVTWTTFSTAQPPLSTSLSPYMTTQYRCIVTCSLSNQSAISTPVTVEANACGCVSYCTPYVNNPCNIYGYLTQVSTTGGITNFTNNTGCSSGGYGNYVGTFSASQYPGSSITMSLNGLTSAPPLKYAVFVDWNGDGDFGDLAESVLQFENTSLAHSVSGSFVVPSWAGPGTYRMRVIGDFYWNGMPTACGPLHSGETEDYCFTVVPPPACTGAPNPGVTTSTVSNSCPGSSFQLSLSTPPVASGLSYNWEYSTDGGNTWTSFSTSAPPVSASLNGFTTTQYRCSVTCLASVQSAISAPVTITSGTSCECSSTYCSVSVSSPCNSYYGYISFVSTSGGITNFSNSTSCSSGGYGNFANTYSVSQYPGGDISLTITSYSGWGYSFNYRVFVDWNNDGDFNDFSEQVFSANSSVTATGTVSVPSWAAPGSYRMRVMGDVYWNSFTGSCSSLQYGEVEDYCFTVVPAPACSGTPSAGAATATVSAACPSTTFNLNLSPAPVGSNLTYNWELSTDGGQTWTSFSTSAPPISTSLGSFTTTQYRCTVTCSNSGLSAVSTPVTVNGGSYCECVTYCSASVVGPCDWYYGYINSVSTSGGITNFSNSGSGCSSGYQKFAGSYSVSQYPGFTVNISISKTAGYWYWYWYYSNFAIYIDWNGDGDFNDNQELVHTAYHTTSTSTTLTVPSWVSPGTYRMRVMMHHSSYGTPSSCGTIYYGEYEDYCFTVSPFPQCSGTPNPGSTTASVTSTCPSQTFTLNLSNTLVDLGLSYTWQSSTDGGLSWQTFSNAVPPLSTSLTSSVTTQYRCIVKCTNTGDSAISTPVTVYSNPCQCVSYCTPQVSNPCHSTYGHITYVATSGGISNFSNSTGCSWGYGNYAGSYSVSQYPGASITIHLNKSGYYQYWWWNYTYYPSNYAVYVDWNGDGDFDDAQEQALVITNATNTSGSILVPSWVTPGTYRMRVMMDVDWNGIPGSCSTLYSGEIEDYCFTVAQPPVCSGTPSPGNTTASVTSACPSTSFTLSLSTPPVGINFSYNWELSTDGGNTWTSFSSSPPPLSVTLNNYTTTQYRCTVTCLTSGQSATSTPVTVTSSHCQCVSYCTPTITSPCSWWYGGLTSVTTSGGTVNITNNTGCSSSGYQNYAGVHQVSQSAGSSVNITLTSTSSNSFGYNYKVFVDWNDDGDFMDADEVALDLQNVFTGTGVINVPAWAQVGTHRMRIVGTTFWVNVANPCSTLSHGEVEDYCFTVLPQPVCSGTPAPGSTVASVPSACSSSTPITLNFSQSLTAGGYTYVWEVSTDGGATWTSFSTSPPPVSATLNPFTTSQFRCTVTCTQSGQSTTSAPVTVSAATSCECVNYCSPTVSTPCHWWYEGITNVTTSNALTNFSNTTGCSSTGYQNFAGIFSASQYVGGTFDISISSSSQNSFPYNYRVLVDWNLDGDFLDANEQVLNLSNVYTGTGTIQIPSNIQPGIYRMRVIGTTYWVNINNSCATMNHGEVEDYCLGVEAIPCSGVPDPGVVVTSVPSACNQNVSMNLTGAPTFTANLAYQWQYSTDGGLTWNNFGTSNSSAVYPFDLYTTWFRCVVTCLNSGLDSATAPVQVVSTAFTLYQDQDSDGYGNPMGPSLVCSNMPGLVSDNTDCNDSQGSINPVASETCNGVDDNCNSLVDEGVQITFYADSDGDSFGNPSVMTQACSVPSGYVSNNSDCDDAQAFVHPNAQEWCGNNTDDDCDGLIDDADPSVSGTQTWYADSDGDGSGNASVSVSACVAPSGYVSSSGDCDDNDPSNFPTNTEVWDCQDNDCDGFVDEGTNALTLTLLDNASCGITVSNFSHVLRANAMPGAVQYEFEFTDDMNNIYYELRPNRGFYFSLFTWPLYNRTYAVRVRWNDGNNWSCWGPYCLVHTPIHPVTYLENASCGGVATSPSHVFRAISIPGAVQYEFEFVHGSNTYYEVRPNRAFYFGLFTWWQGGVTYQVRVRWFDGYSWSSWGPACNVTAPVLPTTQLDAASCGAIATSASQVFRANEITGAVQYEFEFVHGSQTWYQIRPNRAFYFSLFNWWQFNTTYQVRVRWFNGTQWSNWGPVCSLTAPPMGTTQLQSGDCGATVTSASQVLRAVNMSGATQYEFKVSNGTNTWYLLRPNRGFYFSLFGLPAGTFAPGTYTVQVRWSNGSIWSSWGPVCNIFLSVPLTTEAQDVPSSLLDVKVFPVPFKNNFNLAIETLSEEPVHISIMDLNGRITEDYKLSVEHNGLITLGENLAAGVYVLRVIQGTEVRTIRVVKAAH